MAVLILCTFYFAVEAGGTALHDLHISDDLAEAWLTLSSLLVLQALQELVVL